MQEAPYVKDGPIYTVSGAGSSGSLLLCRDNVASARQVVNRLHSGSKLLISI